MRQKNTSLLLQRLRSLMKDTTHMKESIQAYIIPSGDAHQNEYIDECDKRRAFISGFTGSTGTAVVTEHAACIWTDGRYFLQASKEMDSNWTLMKEGVPSTPTQGAWLSRTLPVESRIGVDPFLMEYSIWSSLASQLKTAGHRLVPVTQNLIDLLWDHRPSITDNQVVPLELKYTGLTWEEKVEDMRCQMQEKGATLLVLTALDEVAWLLNLRGSDIPYNPVFFSYAAVTMNSTHLFINKSKLTPAVMKHLSESKSGKKVQIHPYEEVKEFLQNQVRKQDGKIWLSNKSSYGMADLIPERKRLMEVTCVCTTKAVKNSTEKSGLINAHIRDAAALCCYFSWLEKEIPKGSITEISAAEKLEEFRREQTDFIGPSFATISASGPNGSIIHYKPNLETNRRLTTEELYLCDSGGQYLDGTTDVTRTMHLGVPTDWEKECFTRVLKGQISLATCIFPTKIKGNCLDSLARRPLWDVGLDYMHGTGHGIGAFLNTHEGPMGISWRPNPDDPGLQEGMFLSDEPGYYEDGKFGVRIESILQIVPAQTPHNFKDRGFLTFKAITLVPIQLKMIMPEMLTEDEITYINNYHAECQEIVGKLLKEMGKKEALQWLLRETEHLG